MTVRQIARRIATQAGRSANRALVGTYNSVARLRAVLARLVGRVNGDRATAAAYLTDTLGADGEFVRRFQGPYGKAATKVMREQGVEPTRDGIAVVARHGHPALVRVNTYPVEALAAAARSYARTAELIGAS